MANTDPVHACKKCGEVKAWNKEFFRECNEVRNSLPYRYLKKTCRACDVRSAQSWVEKNQDKYRATYLARPKKSSEEYKHANLRTNHGISLAEFKAMCAAQSNRCKICAVDFALLKPKAIHVDHSHSTGEIRGILCTNCNTGLGQFKDSKELLNSAISYLDGAKYE